MKIPAEAFTYGRVNGFRPGQLLAKNGDWFLLTSLVNGDECHALALNGRLIGQLVIIRAHDQMFAISPAFCCKPLLGAPPHPAQAQPGSLFFSPDGPALRSWVMGQMIYAFSPLGQNVTQNFPFDAVSVAVWSMGLYREENPAVLVDILFEVDATPVNAAA